MSNSTGHAYLKNYQVSGEILLLNVEEESDTILEAARAAEVGHAAKTLVKDGPLRMIVLGFKAGASLREHSAGGPVSIQALSGRVEVSTEGRSHSLDAGRTLVINSAIPHSVTASSDAVLLLTIAWPEKTP